MKKITILEQFYDDRWEFCQVIKGTAEEAIIHFYNVEHTYPSRPVAFRKSTDGWTYPDGFETLNPIGSESVSHKCKCLDDEPCRAREVYVQKPDLSPMEWYASDYDACEHCGRSDDTRHNGSGELQCDNCGWSETG